MRTPMPARLATRLPPEAREAFGVHFAVVFVMISLLSLGYYHDHALRIIAAQHGLQKLIHGWDASAWIVWLAAAPAMLWLVRRYPLARDRLGPNLLRLAAGNLAVYFVVTNARYLLRIAYEAAFGGDWRALAHEDTFATIQVMRLPLDFITYGGFLAAAFAIDYYFKDRRRSEEVQRLQLHAAWLQSELSEAQLAALRGQVHPHFLFNAFNAISTLVRQGRNGTAVDMIARLSALLRTSMESIDRPELPLALELDFARSYLEIERVRFGDRLTVAAEVEPEALGALVPNLLLQPLVENAVKHGIAQRVADGRVELKAARRGGRLALEVADNGPGWGQPGGGAKPPGIGLRNLHRRLSRAYGDDYRLDVGPRAGGGTAVRIDLPWRAAGEAPA